MAAVDTKTAQLAEAEMAVNENVQTESAAPPTETSSAPAAEPAPLAASVPATTTTATAAAPAPVEDKIEGTKETAAATVSGPVWPEVADDSPLGQLIAKTPELVKEAGYDEVYGINLTSGTAFQRNLILQKFLRANANDVAKAAEQLKNTLVWRKEFKPSSLPAQTFSQDKFGKLAYISTLTDVPGSTSKSDVACWNIYGAVEDNEKTFGDLDAFSHWRVAVMEAALARLRLADATEPIPDHGQGADPYQMIQIHDYLNVSFLPWKQNPHQKAAASKAIELFSAYYPETLSRKMFVNVPTVMGWMFSAIKTVLPRETVRKFTVLSDGKYLVDELGKSVPEQYGGTGEGLDKAEQLKLE